MYQNTTFVFGQPFCECEKLQMGWGITMSNGEPCMAFQCQTCMTVLTVPFAKLEAGFKFGYLPPNVEIFVGGKEQNQDEDEDSQQDVPVGKCQQEDNVIVGPWAGSKIPSDQQD